MNKRQLVMSTLLLFFVSPVPAGTSLTVFKSELRPPHLLELYTSEGCASCPPADLWFRELKSEPGLWNTFVLVAYHIDYWDHLGWKDRLGSRKHSVRQRQQAEAGKVYTPGFFLNGKEWRGFYDSESLPPADAPSTGILTVTETQPLEFVVEYQPKGIEKGPLEINAALMGMEIQTQPSAGENRGKILDHDFAALGFRTMALTPSGGRFTATIKLRNDTQTVPARFSAAFWVTRPGSFAPIQAVGGFLPDKP